MIVTERDAGTVELQEWQPAEGHAQIDEAEDGKYDRRHGGICQRPCSQYRTRAGGRK